MVLIQEGLAGIVEGIERTIVPGQGRGGATGAPNRWLPG